MSATILILAPEATGEEAAQALRHVLDADVHLQASVQDGATASRTREYALILLDETLALGNQDATESLYAHSTAPVVELSFTRCSVPRIVRQTRAALVRRARDLAIARTAAASALESELNQTLAGLMLESELALRQATPDQQPRLREVVQMAGSLRDQLKTQVRDIRDRAN